MKRNLVFILILGICVLILGCTEQAIKQESEVKQPPSPYEKIIKTIQIDPTLVKIKKNHEDRTAEFLEKYQAKIEQGDFDEALAELEKNKYSISIEVVSSNREVVLGSENRAKKSRENIYLKALKAIKLDPEVVTIIHQKEDITQDFLHRHLEKIKQDTFDEAMKELDKNDYAISFVFTPKNADILLKTEENILAEEMQGTTEEERKALNQKAVKAIQADPKAVKIYRGKKESTEQFLNKYLEDIEKGNFDEVLDELLQNNYSFGFEVTLKNKKILLEGK